LGGSYEFLNRYVGGINFKCSEDEPLTLNPFLFVKKDGEGKWTRPSEDDSEFITNLIFTAWQSANAQAKITSEVNAVLKELIIGFFEYCNEAKVFPTFTEFYHFSKEQLLKNKIYKGLTERHFDKESFLLVMRAFIEEGRGEKAGQYHYLFNTRENADVLNNPFVIFELEQIKENKVLLPISFYIVTRIVLEKLLRRVDKTQRVYYILDEAWMLLARADLGEVAGLFIEYSYRTFRKHGGSIAIATQNVPDVFANPRIGQAILQNCDTLIIKKQNEKDMEMIKEKLNLNEHNCNLLFSIKDKHKEVYMQFKDQAIVAKIETSFYNVGMYSTDPGHKEFIRRQLKKNKNNLHGALIAFEDKFSNQSKTF
jgi:type IV secretory pathway VirB4 component